MKKGIHPAYMNARIVCVCGNVIETRDTQPEIHVEICSNCHPYYTGKQKLVDTAGRVERFRQKYEKAKAAARPKSSAPETPATRETLAATQAPAAQQAPAPEMPAGQDKAAAKTPAAEA